MPVYEEAAVRLYKDNAFFLSFMLHFIITIIIMYTHIRRIKCVFEMVGTYAAHVLTLLC